MSEKAGIYGSEIGFGLGVAVGDVNRDGWPDIYVSNDFFERDYLYINKRDGTFAEDIEQQMPSISYISGGLDEASIRERVCAILEGGVGVDSNSVSYLLWRRLFWAVL